MLQIFNKYDKNKDNKIEFLDLGILIKDICIKLKD